ncbi:MAG: LLM class flavin-dependent oxidoreductase [Solirubrobacterales bacterium]|nr:LLM class flavin-dependent oxidoreductase [Solirubrobacterales bacterium]
MTEIVRLSVLDQSPVAEGSTGSQALHNTLDLARTVDALGFHRYWVAEHHGGPSLAGASPEVLIGPLAAATEHLRVGSGGVMLPHYSPLKVAESFSILAGLFPGRIDVGIGRASGTDPMTTQALQRDREHRLPDDFTSQLAELLAYLDDDFPAGHPLVRLAAALPGRGADRADGPQPWLLGSSAQSAIWAAELGLPYAVADFINADAAPNAQLYRERFQPSERLAHPQVIAAIWTIVAESDEEARRLASSAQMTFAMLRRGRLIPVPPVETALRFLKSEGKDAGRRGVVGSPGAVHAGLEQRAAEYGAEEVMAVTITYDHAARVRSHELLAEAFDLAVPSPLVAAAAHL